MYCFLRRVAMKLTHAYNYACVRVCRLHVLFYHPRAHMTESMCTDIRTPENSISAQMRMSLPLESSSLSSNLDDAYPFDM